MAKDTGLFKEYRRKAAETIKAGKMESPFELNGVQFEAGDYIVQDVDGTVSGAKAAEFDEQYEPSRKTWSRTKKDKTVEGQPAATEAEQAQPAQAAN